MFDFFFFFTIFYDTVYQQETDPQTKATVTNINIDFLRCSYTYLQLYHTNK